MFYRLLILVCATLLASCSSLSPEKATYKNHLKESARAEFNR